VRIARPQRLPRLYDASQPLQKADDGAFYGGRIFAMLTVEKAGAHQPINVGFAILDS
jgi:hypothetical protein